MQGLQPPDAIPRPLKTYLFCCPTMDANLRCMPKAGGYYDQDYIDVVWFRVIENKIAEIRRQENERERIKHSLKSRR